MLKGQGEGLAGGEGLRTSEVGAGGQPRCCGPGRSRLEEILGPDLKGPVEGTHGHRLQRCGSAELGKVRDVLGQELRG